MQSTVTEPTTQLTPRQLQLLKIIARSQHSQCYSPTIAELACELDISRSTVFGHIAELRRKGLLSGSPNMARSLKPTSKAHELLDGLGSGITSSFSAGSRGIALCGRVAAGAPIEAVENIEQLSLDSCFGTGDDIFALEVKGDSMAKEDIHEGDYVICRRSRLADDGQLVVAIVDEEYATLKRFYRERNRARLQPANDDYEPIYCDNCRIEGVVIGLLRRL